METLKLKPLHKESIPAALNKARRYRLLNEPWQAESICRDILNSEPDDQVAMVTLILAITDQFNIVKTANSSEAKDLCKKLENEYHKNYYRGIIEERLGKTAIKRSGPRVKYIAYDLYARALGFFEKAEQLRPEDNEDTILRWNACVRAIQEYKLEPSRDIDEVRPFME